MQMHNTNMCFALAAAANPIMGLVVYSHSIPWVKEEVFLKNSNKVTGLSGAIWICGDKLLNA